MSALTWLFLGGFFATLTWAWYELKHPEEARIPERDPEKVAQAREDLRLESLWFANWETWERELEDAQ